MEIQVKVKLEVDGLLKFVEEDNFQEGCDPKTAQSYMVDFSGKYESQEALIKGICDFLGIDDNPENYQINSCDEIGRIDFSVMENEEGYQASQRELNLFKEGKCRLWYAVYIAKVESVTREPFNLTA